MKNTESLLFALLILSFTARSQQDTSPPGDADPSSSVNYYEIKNARINFFSVNNRYKCIDPRIFFVDRPGFVINLGWDSVQINNEWYIILSYPAFRNGKRDTAYVANSHTPQIDPSWLTSLPAGLRSSLDSLVKAGGQATAQPLDISQSGDWERVPLDGKNGLLLMIKKSDFDQLAKAPLYSTAFKWNRLAFSSGQLTVPFKLRPALAGNSFSMTTDVTIGAYAGLKKRISKRQNFFLTLPVVAGLTLINVNDNTTTSSGTPDRSSGVYPGWTVATGLVAQLNSFNIGVVTGWDFASDVGKTWIYQGKQWISFGIGYSFLK
jgi:hypothetical protein